MDGDTADEEATGGACLSLLAIDHQNVPATSSAAAGEDSILDADENSRSSKPEVVDGPGIIVASTVSADEDEEISLADVPEKADPLPEADSISLSQSESDSVGKVKLKTPRAVLAPDVTHIPIQPSDIIEYEWPQKSGDRFFIQEQISDLLGINSFKRKYPDMTRRTVEPAERDHLVKELKLNFALPSHHLTALQSVDVHELMSSEYPAIYAEYQKACNERVKLAMIAKQKELDAIKLDAKKLAELRQKAINNAREFNSELQFLRKSERQLFWETNTNVIHSPLNKWTRLSAEHTKPSKYPVFLMPGQYTSYYKRFDPAQLRAFPFESVVENDELFPPKREPSPPAILVSEKELEAAAKNNGNGNQQQDDGKHDPLKGTNNRLVKQELPTPKSPQKDKDAASAPPIKMRKISAPSTSLKGLSWATSTPKVLFQSVKATAQTSRAQQQQQVCCSVCQLPDPSSMHKALLVQCSSCRQQMHSSCIDMPLNMVEVIRKYDWLCIDCKRCSVCQQPDQEAAMMCCDACDRGYHTFCIGLEVPPNGTWHCPECKGS